MQAGARRSPSRRASACVGRTDFGARGPTRDRRAAHPWPPETTSPRRPACPRRDRRESPLVACTGISSRRRGMSPGRFRDDSHPARMLVRLIGETRRQENLFTHAIDGAIWRRRTTTRLRVPNCLGLLSASCVRLYRPLRVVPELLSPEHGDDLGVSLGPEQRAETRRRSMKVGAQLRSRAQRHSRDADELVGPLRGEFLRGT
jgi:hypothetical protein